MSHKLQSGRFLMKRYLPVVVLFGFGLGLASAINQSLVGPQAIAQSTSTERKAGINPANVVGHAKCAECHKSEVAALQKSPHGSQSYQQLSHAKAPLFAKAMGITGNLESSLCANCHATKTAAAAIQAVSCEACHGAAGPEKTGWFAFHSDFGNADKDRKKETKQHHAKRIAASRKLGMNRSADVYEIATNCLSCHTVPNEKLFNAGHPNSKRFELVEWSQGSVRHNFQLDQSVNTPSPSLWLDPLWNGSGRTAENRKKLMYVVGQLVDLEISLRNRAKAAKGDFGSAAGRRISSARRKLAKVDHISEVKQALAAISAIDRKALRTYGARDAKLFGNAADQVAAAAKALAKGRDGSKLGDVDVPSNTVGDAYQP